MKIYAASSWRNELQPSVVAQLRAAGFSCYDFRNPAPDEHGFSWSEIDPNWQQWTAAQFRDALKHPVAIHGLKLDFDAMRWSDAIVMVQPCGRSAALELGWAIGAGKRTIILLAEKQEPELMFALADKLCLTMDEVVAELRRPPAEDFEPWTLEEMQKAAEEADDLRQWQRWDNKVTAFDRDNRMEFLAHHVGSTRRAQHIAAWCPANALMVLGKLREAEAKADAEKIKVFHATMALEKAETTLAQQVVPGELLSVQTALSLVRTALV